MMIGTRVTEQMEADCYARGIRVSAADIAQKYMAHGLEQLPGVDRMDVIGAVRAKPWPRVRIARFHSDTSTAPKGSIQSIGYLNLPAVGFALRERAIVSAAKKWARAHKEERDAAVLIYSMHSPFMKAAKAVKRINPHVRIVLTVADLPLFMDMRGRLRRVLKQMDWRRIRSLMSSVDKYLLYTRYMADYLELAADRWMVFEGLIDESRVVTVPQEKYEESICLYAGNLDARYGIDCLIEAFGKISCDAKLYIYGAGADKERIATLVRDMPNVEYRGHVTQDEIFSIMKRSHLLLNPRPSAIGLAKYSCPSKTFEYMASGTPTMMNHLPGVPEEYDPYIYFFPEESAEGYAEAIDAFFARPPEERIALGMRAAGFLMKEKNSRTVMQKVCNFIEK